jgi:hypothetical protein
MQEDDIGPGVEDTDDHSKTRNNTYLLRLLKVLHETAGCP